MYSIHEYPGQLPGSNGSMHLEAITMSATDAIISANSHGDIISWNPAAEKIFGYTVEEVKGKSLTIVIPERFHQLPQQAIESGSILLPAAARIINPGEDLHAFIARIQLLAIDSTIGATGNYPNAASRLGYGRTSLISLRSNLRKGIYRKRKTPPSTKNPDQPSLPVD